MGLINSTNSIMKKELKYVPVFRSRQQELAVLKCFDFKDQIFPCLEIVKEIDRLSPKPRKGSKKAAKQKTFEEVYLPLIANVNAQKVFVDLPVHLKEKRGMKKATLSFITGVISRRSSRTEYLKKLSPLSKKVIPVISTYFGRTNERDSIRLQEIDLRPIFSTLAFRTFRDSFSRDITQLQSIVRKNDYVIMDWEDSELDLEDPEVEEINGRLSALDCTIIIHRNPIPNGITNVGLTHNSVVSNVNNNLIELFKDFGGSCFSDYAGIKKDNISDGGTVSPGFLFYDAVKNKFYGYKGNRKDLEEFETTIVPAIISSQAAKRMRAHALDFIGGGNKGWQIIQSVYNEDESGKSPAKFKRIGMQHYLHCIKIRIENEDFD
jgi:hypothetical protein